MSKIKLYTEARTLHKQTLHTVVHPSDLSQHSLMGASGFTGPTTIHVKLLYI